jgi:hypothetical protein
VRLSLLFISLILPFVILTIYSIQILRYISHKRVSLVIEVLIIADLYVILNEEVIYDGIALAKRLRLSELWLVEHSASLPDRACFLELRASRTIKTTTFFLNVRGCHIFESIGLYYRGFRIHIIHMRLNWGRHTSLLDLLKLSLLIILQKKLF